MALLPLSYLLGTLFLVSVIGSFVYGPEPFSRVVIYNLKVSKGGAIRSCLIAIASHLLVPAVLNRSRSSKNGTMYGLQHGRLHLQTQTPMWMNMGYWKEPTASTSLSIACRDLLTAILAEAGLSRKLDKTEKEKGLRRTKCLIDLGVGCGDQSIYLMSDAPLRPSDGTWWDNREHCVEFDQYIGITNDRTQAQYASERLAELQNRKTLLFCADAAKPESWDMQLQNSIQRSKTETSEHWVLALDTAYHFAPSRWHLIKYIHQDLNASFMAFDLCISPNATPFERFKLRVLTAFMKAPWANFTTPLEYRAKLVEIGYQSSDISITDVSEHVFTPLSNFLDGQDRRLAVLGLGLGALGVAKKMFAWWGRTGIVRGVIVVARHPGKQSQGAI
ncbi:hypothetical protein NX059_007990 [Plenodomus lindquistii]|nr:hypothetical protein NX059_007990 [Plenodomus lindquistii]